MPHDHPVYKNVREPAPTDDLHQEDFVWDVRAEQESGAGDESVVDPPSQPSMAVEHDSKSAAVSEVLRRFPRPGPLANRADASRRPSSRSLVFGAVFAVVTAAAAAWFVA